MPAGREPCVPGKSNNARLGLRQRNCKGSKQKQHPVSPPPKRVTPRYAGYGPQVGKMRGPNNLTTRNIVHGRSGKRAFLAVAHDGLQEKPKGS